MDKETTGFLRKCEQVCDDAVQQIRRDGHEAGFSRATVNSAVVGTLLAHTAVVAAEAVCSIKDQQRFAAVATAINEQLLTQIGLITLQLRSLGN